MDFLKLLEQRYTTKHYDAARVVPEEKLTAILEATRLTPTSVNGQPYHFYVLSGEAKQKFRPAVLDFNIQRYDGASHAVVITSKLNIDEPHLQAVLKAEEAAGRLPTPELVAAQDKSRHYFNQLHVDKGDYAAWTGKQAYIAFATMVYAAADVGVDSTALEGLNYDLGNEILDLVSKNETLQLVVLLGYRDPNDSNTIDKRPKSRLNLDQLVTYL